MARMLEFSEDEAAELLDYLGDASNGMSEYGGSLESFDALEEMERKVRLFLFGAVGDMTVRMPRPEPPWNPMNDWLMSLRRTEVPFMAMLPKSVAPSSAVIEWGFAPTSGDQAD